MQERRNSIANALELRLSCINPSIWNSINVLLVRIHLKRLAALNHWGLVIPYDVEDFGKPWFM